MARYINADVLRELIDGGYDLDFSELPETKRELLHMIDYQETADVREVKRGHWVKLPGFATPGGDPVWGCSECGKGVHIYGIEANTYAADVADHQWVSCPNCGADMRGE